MLDGAGSLTVNMFLLLGLFAVMARHGNAAEADSARPVQYSTSDIIITFTPAPTHDHNPQ